MQWRKLALSILSVCTLMVSIVGVPQHSVLAQTQYTLNNLRQYRVTFSQMVENTGTNVIYRQDVWSAIPATDFNQTVLSLEFDPQPTEILTDNWGQKIAHYVISNMPAKSNLEISWTAEIQISDISFQVSPSVSMDNTPIDIIQAYTKDDENFMLSSTIVQQAAREAIGSQPSLYDKINNIYGYVIDHLSYSLDGGWDNAATVLARGTGSCSEYAFVTVALLRANGIPARLVGGSRNRSSTEGDYVDTVFHRSVEVYLPDYGWVPIDTCLGDTKSRSGYLFQRYNDHFIFSTEGGRSSLLRWDYRSRFSVASTVIVTRSAQWKAQNIASIPPAELVAKPSPDTTTPIISGATGSTSGTTGEPVLVAAKVNKNDVVGSVNVHYIPIGSSERSVAMTNGIDDIWGASIPVATNKIGTITYYINTQDTTGKVVRCPAIGSYSIRVIDNDKPVVKAGLDKSAVLGQILDFDGSGSYDNIGITSFAWDFGDGSPQVNNITASHVYSIAGIYTVTLTLDDAAGNGPVTDTLTVSVTTLTTPPTIASITPSSVKRGQTLSVNITGTDLTGIKTVSFGKGISIISFKVLNSTQIMVRIRINSSATLGTRDVSITTPAGTCTGFSKFIVVK